MLRKVISNKIYEADPTNSPTINQRSPHRRTGQEPDGRRGTLPRHVRWTNRSHASRYVVGRNASHTSQDAEFASNAERRDYERQ
jgi:hypothetical protein